MRIDRRRKMPVTILLKAMGNSTQFILNYFYSIEQIFLEGGRLFMAVNDSLLGGKPLRMLRRRGEMLSSRRGERFQNPC